MPKSNAAYLPSEVIGAIIKQLPKETQIVCQYVCKSWYYPARQLFYNTVAFMGKRDDRLPKLIYCLENPSAGSMVKLLRIEGDRKPVLTREELIRLINSCPSLQELAMCNNATYLGWLMDDEIIELNDLKVLSPIKGKMSWRCSENNRSFYKAAHKFCNSIEVLQIPCSCNAVIEQEFGNIFNYLHSFSRLRELVMVNGSQMIMVYLHSLLDTCHRLEKLDIQLGHPLFDPATTTIDLHTLTVYPAMQELDIFLPKFSINHFQYFIKRFVNLRRLHVTINQGQEDWGKDKKAIKQFLEQEYVPFVKKLDSTSLVIRMNGSSCISDSFSSFTSLDKNAKLKSHFELDGGRAERDNISLNTVYKDNKLCTTSQYTFTRDFSFSSSELPYIKHLQNYGANINALELKFLNSVKRPFDLGLILNQCPNMEELEVDIALQTPREYSWYSQMQIYNGTPNVYINNEEEKLNFYHNNLLALKLQGVMITPSLLNSISRFAPNIQKIDLRSCSYRLLEEMMHIQDPCRFDMSNSSLKQFTLDTSFFYSPSRQCTGFIITSISKECSDYYVLDQRMQCGEGPFTHVSEANFHQHLAAVDQSYLAVEFIIKSLETMTVHIGKFAHQQRAKQISFPDETPTI